MRIYSEQEIADLVFEARLGNKVARDELIVAHRGLAMAFDDEDMRGDAELKLVEAVDAYLEGRIQARSLSSYLKVVTKHAATSTVRDEARHKSRLRKAFHGGSKVMIVKARAGKMSFSGAGNTNKDEVTSIQLPRKQHDFRERLAAEELLLKCADDAFKKDVIHLSLLGHKYGFIAQALKTNKMAISRAIGEMRECLRAYA